MKESKMVFDMHSYMGITAIEYGKTYDDDYSDKEPPQYTIFWTNNPVKFAESLRTAADFLEKYANGHRIEVNID